VFVSFVAARVEVFFSISNEQEICLFHELIGMSRVSFNSVEIWNTYWDIYTQDGKVSPYSSVGTKLVLASTLDVLASVCSNVRGKGND